MFLKLTGSVCVLVACVGFVREILRTGNLHRKMLESLIEMTELLAAEIRWKIIQKKIKKHNVMSYRKCPCQKMRIFFVFCFKIH